MQVSVEFAARVYDAHPKSAITAASSKSERRLISRQPKPWKQGLLLVRPDHRANELRRV
jgi:hypothetical protein